MPGPSGMHIWKLAAERSPTPEPSSTNISKRVAGRFQQGYDRARARRVVTIVSNTVEPQLALIFRFPCQGKAPMLRRFILQDDSCIKCSSVSCTCGDFSLERKGLVSGYFATREAVT